MTDILRTASKSTALRFISNPIMQIINDGKSIYHGEKIPEHIIHLTSTSTMLILGISMPFISTIYGDWLGTTISSIGLTGGAINGLSKVLISGWLFSYPTSAITDWSTMAVCKCIFGDWTYRLTNKQCTKLADDLAISELEARERFDELVQLYRNSPKITGLSKEYIRRILDRLKDGDFGALEDHDVLRNTILERRRTLERRRSKLKKAREEQEDINGSPAIDIELLEIVSVPQEPVLYGLDRYIQLRKLGKNQTLTRHEGSIVKELLRLDSYLEKHKISI